MVNYTVINGEYMFIVIRGDRSGEGDETQIPPAPKGEAQGITGASYCTLIVSVCPFASTM